MQLTATAFEFIEEVDQKTDIPSLVESFQNLIRRFGMDCFMLGDPSRPHENRDDRLIASTWPEGWLSHWLSSNYIKSDPVLHQLLSRNEPVQWSRITANDQVGTRILDEANEFRMTDGFALPIYTRDGFAVGLTMGTEHDLSNGQARLHLASIYFHAAEKLRAESTQTAVAPDAARAECLTWVAPADRLEISDLNIAEQTAHEYVQNANQANSTTRPGVACHFDQANPLLIPRAERAAVINHPVQGTCWSRGLTAALFIPAGEIPMLEVVTSRNAPIPGRPRHV